MTHKVLLIIDDKEYRALQKMACAGEQRLSISSVAGSIVTGHLNRQDKPNPYGKIDCGNCKNRWCEELTNEQ